MYGRIDGRFSKGREGMDGVGEEKDNNGCGCYEKEKQRRTVQVRAEKWRGMDSSVLKDYICFHALVKQRVLSSSPCR